MLRKPFFFVDFERISKLCIIVRGALWLNNWVSTTMQKLLGLQLCVLFASLPLLASVGRNNHGDARILQPSVVSTKMPTGEDLKSLIDETFIFDLGSLQNTIKANQQAAAIVSRSLAGRVNKPS